MTLSSVDRYDRTVLAPNQLGLIERVLSGSTVLELGASTGYMSLALRSKSCHVTAVECDREALTILNERADETHYGDLEDPESLRYLEDRQFDVILLADVLEHLREPKRTLQLCRQWLAPKGTILVSMPNVAFWRVRLNLACGRWEMTPNGILDETHLRFFTRSTAERMFGDAGYMVVESATVWDEAPLDQLIPRSFRRLWAIKRRMNRVAQLAFPALLAYQYLWQLTAHVGPDELPAD